jgi:hypothetical protein
MNLSEARAYLADIVRKGTPVALHYGYDLLGFDTNPLRAETWVRSIDHIGFGCFKGQVNGQDVYFDAGGASAHLDVDGTTICFTTMTPFASYPYDVALLLFEAPWFETPEEAREWIYSKHEYDCPDGFRYHFRGDTQSEADDDLMIAYDRIQSMGCCGFDDDNLVFIGGRAANIGCNYGH